MKHSFIDIDSSCAMDIILVLNQQFPSTLTKKMDISACLNISDECGRETMPMDLDSPASPAYSHQTSRRSSASYERLSPQLSHVDSRTLPPIAKQQLPMKQEQAPSQNTLPSIKTLLQNIGPSPLLKHEKLDYCTQMGLLEVQKKDRLNCQSLPRLHRFQSTDSIKYTLNDYQQQSLLFDEHTRTRLSRRRSHHSPRSPRSPRSPHHRIFRRGSHPQTAWSVPIGHGPHDKYSYQRPPVVAEDLDTYYDSSPSPQSKAKPSSTHNNKPYTVEMIDWIRYHRVDRGMAFKADMMPLFFEQFPERYDRNATDQILSSRYYRDNDRPWLDEKGNWAVDDKGALRTVPAKVRDASTAEGKELDFPRSLVDKWPARLLCEKYTHWKSPILEEDRERARRILAGNDPSDRHGKRAEWRRILCECENLIYKPQLGDA